MIIGCLDPSGYWGSTCWKIRIFWGFEVLRIPCLLKLRNGSAGVKAQNRFQPQTAQLVIEVSLRVLQGVCEGL